MTEPTNPTPCRACPTDPPTDRNAPVLSANSLPPNTVPPNLANVLSLVQILLTYGRHLADTFARRSTARGFHLIARHFGTSRLAVILAHIRRGILRAAALERVLLDRAATGRDLTIPPVRARRPRRAPEPTPPDAAANPPEPKPAPKHAPRPAWRDHWLHSADDPLDPRHLPSFEELVKQARRDPIGRTLGKIKADLGIAPALCLAPFWNGLFMAMLRYDGSPGTYDVHRWRREQQFEQEQDRRPTMDLSWPPLQTGGGRGHIIQALGFFIGQDPVEPPIIATAAKAPQAPALSAASAQPPRQTARVKPSAPRAAPATGPP